MKALYNILQGGVVKNVTLNKNQSAIMVQKLPVISLLLLYRDIHAKRHLLKRHISASRKARNFLKIAFYSYEKSFFGSFFFKSSKPHKD